MRVIEATTADEAWSAAARLIEAQDGTLNQSGRGGDTRELLHTCLIVSDPRSRWVLNRRPPINPAFALAEVIWILSGRDDSGFLNFWNPVLPKFAGRGPLYYGAYGQRLRYRFGIDQIRFAFETLRANPESRQAVLQIWDAASDLPLEGGQPRSPDIPCNVCSLVKIRQGRLEWVQIMRSNDLQLGWPHNVVQFTTIQEMMAAWLGVDVGTYTHFSDSLHVYVDQVHDLIEPVVLILEPNADRWELPYDETMDVIEDIGRRMDAIRANARDAEVIRREGTMEHRSRAATNALRLIAADAARRARLHDLADELVARCSNPVLLQLWRRWLERQRSRAEETDPGTA
jgi:thymidylate synthase